ncbi:MAG: bile acid:sodium symporter family protein [Parabacteroides sp.]
MLPILQAASRWLAHYTSFFIILTAIASLCCPELFAWVQQGNRPSIILGIIMLTMGCTLTTQDFQILFRRPLDIFIGSVAQFTIMPLIAWSLTRLFHLDPFLSAGIILVGCCPGGVSSNIMSFLCKGDVAFSVGMTTASTLLAPLVTPLMVYWLAGTDIHVDTLGMFQNILVVTLLPVAAGCGFNYLFGKRENFRQLQSIMPGISVICLAFIVGGVIYQVHPQLMANGISLILLTLSVVFCHNSLGYLLGYQVGRLCHFSQAKRRTISIEVGMQNAGMATVLANNFFATPAAIAANPMAALSVIPCALSCAYHSISGTILAGLFLKFGKHPTCHSPENHAYQK